MKTYWMRYLIFWLPAVLVSYLFNNDMILSHILLWLSAFFMLFGWSVNTGMAAYFDPRATLAALMTYSGAHLLLILILYNTDSRTGLGVVLRRAGGILSFIPLDIFVQTLSRYRISMAHEFYATALLVAGCVIGYLAGLLRRRIHPDPYRPVIR